MVWDKVSPVHGGWTKTINKGSKELKVYYNFGRCCSGVRSDFYESYHGYFPTTWIKEADLDRWIDVISAAGFPCKREKNEKNVDFSSFADKEVELYHISFLRDDLINNNHALATWTVIRYCYSPTFKQLVQTTFDLLDNIKNIKPLEALLYAHYCCNPEDKIDPDGYTNTDWFYIYHGLLLDGIWKLPVDINTIFKKDSPHGINYSFAGIIQERKKHPVYDFSITVTLGYDKCYYNRGEKFNQASIEELKLKFKLEKYYKESDWKMLTSWYKKLRLDNSIEEVEEPETKAKVSKKVVVKKKSTIIKKVLKKTTKSKKKEKTYVLEV